MSDPYCERCGNKPSMCHCGAENLARALAAEARATAAETDRDQWIIVCREVEDKLAAAEQREAEKDDELRRVIRNAQYGLDRSMAAAKETGDQRYEDAGWRFMAIADMLEPLLSSHSTPEPLTEWRPAERTWNCRPSERVHEVGCPHALSSPSTPSREES